MNKKELNKKIKAEENDILFVVFRDKKTHTVGSTAKYTDDDAFLTYLIIDVEKERIRKAFYGNRVELKE